MANLDDDALVDESSNRGRQRYIEAFTPQRNLLQLEAICRSVMS